MHNIFCPDDEKKKNNNKINNNRIEYRMNDDPVYDEIFIDDFFEFYCCVLVRILYNVWVAKVPSL